MWIGGKLTSILIAIMKINYWSVRSSSWTRNVTGVKGVDEGLLYPATSFTSLENMNELINSDLTRF